MEAESSSQKPGNCKHCSEENATDTGALIWAVRRVRASVGSPPGKG